MKKAFRFILIYFVFLIGGLIAGTFLYSLYLNLTSFVTGKELVMFDFSDFMKAFFFIGYCFIFFICPVLAYYRVRNLDGMAPLIAYVIMSLFTWFLLFPTLSIGEDKFYESNPYESKNTTLSTNVFRKVNDKVYYFTSETENTDCMKGIVIDTDEDKNVFYGDVSTASTEDIVVEALPYREIEVKRTFSNGKLKVLIDINRLIKYGKDSIEKGYLYYLGFVALGFLVASIIGCSRFFKWKVMNSALLMFMTVFMLSLNSFYFLPEVQNSLKNINTTMPLSILNGFSTEPLLFVIDVFLGLIFTVAGIIIIAVKKHKNTL